MGTLSSFMPVGWIIDWGGSRLIPATVARRSLSPGD